MSCSPKFWEEREIHRGELFSQSKGYPSKQTSKQTKNWLEVFCYSGPRAEAAGLTQQRCVLLRKTTHCSVACVLSVICLKMLSYQRWYRLWKLTCSLEECELHLICRDGHELLCVVSPTKAKQICGMCHLLRQLHVQRDP